jgi:hypothetical protein
MKIAFSALSLWPPIGMMFLNVPEDAAPSTKEEWNAAFWFSVIPLGLGLIFAILSTCGFCAKHPQHILRRLLFFSDILLFIGNFVAGVFIAFLYQIWDAACEEGSDFECSLRAVAVRVMVDVFGMGLIHLGTAFYMYRWERVLAKATE